MKNKVSLVILCATSLTLSGCIEGSIIQMKYNRKRDECRLIAEMKADTMIAPAAERPRVPINSDIYAYNNMAASKAPSVADEVPKMATAREKSQQLSKGFNDCMAEHGWMIANPPKDKDEKK